MQGGELPSHLKLGLVTGLVLEADTVRAASAGLDEIFAPLVAQGFGPEAAADGARELVAQGATALLSFGFAGGLDPGLKTGDLLVASSISNEGGNSIAADEDWQAGALRRFRELDAQAGAILSMAGVVADAAYKGELLVRYGAAAVDMESHAVAGVAAESGMPFLALRVILDDARSELPPSALASVDETGAVSPLKAAAALAKRPQDIPAMARLAADNAKASKTLSRVARLGMPLFGLV